MSTSGQGHSVQSDQKGQEPPAAGPRLEAGPWDRTERPRWKKFPGPAGVETPLRVWVDREPYAEMIGHVKQSLDCEVCGVLAGEVLEDDEGVHLHVQGIIAGTAVRQGSTHVTFTHETWSAIYQALDRSFPGLQIVGWYHSHPGFGVQFSEMDLFIQRNYFPAPHQIALVTDPLGGDEAVCFNASGGVKYLDRYWVAGRERQLRFGPAAAASGAGASDNPPGELGERLERVEVRLGQLIQALDEQRRSGSAWLIGMGLFICATLTLWLAYNIHQMYTARFQPPKQLNYAPVPVLIDGKIAYLGIGVVDWQIPDDLNAVARIREDLLRQQAEEFEKAGQPAAAPHGVAKK